MEQIELKETGSQVIEEWSDKEVLLWSTPSETKNRPTKEPYWGCPCIEKQMNGPCRDIFMSYVQCYVNSVEEKQGAECNKLYKEYKRCEKRHGIED